MTTSYSNGGMLLLVLICIQLTTTEFRGDYLCGDCSPSISEGQPHHRDPRWTGLQRYFHINEGF
jgi:hypothetical protein